MPESSRYDSTHLVIENLELTPCCKPFSIALGSGRTLCLLDYDSRTSSLICDILGGYATPSKGKIFLKGHDLLALRPEQRPVGMISRRDPLFDHLNVRDNLLLPLRARGLDVHEQRNVLEKTLALIGLNSCEHLPTKNLTSEQRRRVMIGRVLAYAPSIIVIDALVDDLKVRERRQVCQLLFILQRALRLTIIYKARDREDALWFGDDIALFDKQTLLQRDSAACLANHPASADVAFLFNHANLLRGIVLSLDEGIARIRLACGGIAEAIAAPGLSENALCEVSINPDRVALMPLNSVSDLSDEEPPLIAKSQLLLHEGDRLRLKMRTPDGTELEIFRTPQHNPRSFTPGATLHLAWQASQAVAFPLKDAL